MTNGQIVLYPDWTAKERIEAGGRDFLGLQSVGDAMLDYLLPGVTNQTVHPRYYAFFAWVFRVAMDRGLRLKDLASHRFRNEIALVYAAQAKHGKGITRIVGINSVRKGRHAWHGVRRRYAIDSGQWSGKPPTAFSAPYYGPSFDRLGILAKDRSGQVKLLPLGSELAESFGRGLKQTRILSRLASRSRKHLAGKDLLSLHDDLCPCNVRGGARPERKPLIEMLLGVDNHEADNGDFSFRTRRLSLALVLDFIHKAGNELRSDDDLRSLIYYWRLRSKKRYSPPAELLSVAEGWRLFQARQYQRYALEAMWISFLMYIRSKPLVEYRAEAVAEAFVSGAGVTKIFGEMGISQSIKLQRLTLSDLAGALARKARIPRNGCHPKDSALAWNQLRPPAPECEAGRKVQIDEFLQAGEIELAFCAALTLLVALWFRWGGSDNPQSACAHFLDEGQSARVSLKHMFADFDSLAKENLPALCARLLETYAVGQHLSVAISKYRSEGIDTFWFYPYEDGYHLHPDKDVSKLAPRYNSPKLWAAMSSLYDLALLKVAADGTYACTKEGIRMLNRVLKEERSLGQ